MIRPKTLTRRVRRIEVRPSIADRAKGFVTFGGVRLRCALGPNGVTQTKREGDGATPQGALPIRRIWRRSDRAAMLPAGAPVRITRRTNGWCDAPGHRRYNRPVALPFSASHEAMWRSDGLYDLVAELGWNDAPPTPGRGSAIFLHAARPDFSPTQGCVAVAPAALRRLLARVGPKTRLVIAPKPRKIRRRALTETRAGRPF